MMSEDEARALLDYVLARRNIAAIVTFGQTDTLVGGPSVGGGNTRTTATLDLAAFADEATIAALGAGLVRDATRPSTSPAASSTMPSMPTSRAGRRRPRTPPSRRR